MSRLIGLNAGFVVALCLAGAARAEAGGQWSTLKTEHFTVYYAGAFAADARNAKTFLSAAIEALKHEFADRDPERILKRIDCHVYLHPEPNEHAGDGKSVCITRGIGDGRRHAELHFLTPAQYRADSLNAAGERKNADHSFHRYLVHEYASIWLGIIARDKAKGWYTNGSDAPNWFWQGYEEYLGMTLSSDHSRTVTFAKYMTMAKDDPDSVMVAHGYRDKTPRIVTRRDYIDGFALLAYLHERFGKKAVQDMLASEAPTFRQAMREAVRMDDAELYEDYQRWLEKWQPAAAADAAR